MEQRFIIAHYVIMKPKQKKRRRENGNNNLVCDCHRRNTNHYLCYDVSFPAKHREVLMTDFPFNPLPFPDYPEPPLPEPEPEDDP